MGAWRLVPSNGWRALSQTFHDSETDDANLSRSLRGKAGLSEAVGGQDGQACGNWHEQRRGGKLAATHHPRTDTHADAHTLVRAPSKNMFLCNKRLARSKSTWVNPLSVAKNRRPLITDKHSRTWRRKVYLVTWYLAVRRAVGVPNTLCDLSVYEDAPVELSLKIFFQKNPQKWRLEFSEMSQPAS